MEIKMNKEIRDYKEKVVMGMTLRQITAAASGIVFCVYVVFRLRSISEDFAAFCCILVILPSPGMGALCIFGAKAAEILRKKL